MFDTNKIKRDFPIFKTHPNLVYLDSTATSLKPQSVIDKENEYYTKYTANIFRGIYKISEKATEEYEQVRGKIAHFIGAKSDQEIVFVRNTTEALNLVAAGVGKTLKPEDEIVVSIMEHHSNFVPWQQRSLRKKAEFIIWNLDKEGKLNLSDLEKLLSPKTKLVAITAVSNVLGTINPIKKITQIIKKNYPKCLVLVDGAQAIPHMRVNVTEWGVDALAFSSHKMLGPTGVGVLWAKYALLNQLSPYQYGGEMIQAVYTDHTEFKKPPHKFEAGTPHIAGVIGLGAAIDYLEDLGMNNVRKHEIELVDYALKQLKLLKGLTVYGPQKAEGRGGVLTFTMKEAHAHDIAQILDSNNICIRAGHHCAMPLHLSLNIASTARASFYVYTTKHDIDALVEGLKKVEKIFK